VCSSDLKVLAKEPGFECNIYGDPQCNDFLRGSSDQEPDACVLNQGQGVICFCQECFTNPFFLTKAVVTTGSQKVAAVTSFSDASKVHIDTINQACGDNGCDSGNTMEASYDRSTCTDPRNCPRQICRQTTRVTGNYDNTNQRDYMAGLIKAVVINSTDLNRDIVGTTRDVAQVVNVVNFVQVDINDANGANLAQMTSEIKLECDDGSGSEGFECDLALLGTINLALNQVPAVGGILAGLTTISCGLAKGH
jgi:hypothetical protein